MVVTVSINWSAAACSWCRDVGRSKIISTVNALGVPLYTGQHRGVFGGRQPDWKVFQKELYNFESL
jgi:hypothetical protein